MSLTIEDYKKAAADLCVSVSAVRSVASVESSGKGFFTTDNSPVILYERHIFYRELLQKRNKETQNKVKLANPSVNEDSLKTLINIALREVRTEIDKIVSINPDICNTTAGGYLGGFKEYSRLNKAKTIDEECALRSCSWGAFQVMGFHAEFLGFKDVYALVESAKTDAGQLDIFLRFIKKNPNLLNALKTQNWVSFAKLYNGPAYAKNSYDTKLAAAYKTFEGNQNLA